MKKQILVLIMLMICVPLLFGLSATTDMRLSVYKEDPIPADLDFTVTVKYQNTDPITGMGNLYDISEKVTKETTLYYVGAAFTVGISTTYRTPPEVALTFAPFVNQKNTDLSFPVSYSLSKNTPTVTGNNKVSGSGWFSTSYYYRYTPDVIMKDIGGTSITSVSVASTGTTVTLTQTLGTIQRSTRKGSGYSTIQESDLPSTTNDTLPGLATGQSLSSTAYFKLNIDGNDYQSMMANVDYIATVRLTVMAD